jgi:hypothetical protein
VRSTSVAGHATEGDRDDRLVKIGQFTGGVYDGDEVPLGNEPRWLRVLQL